MEDLEKKEQRIKEREHLIVENEKKLVTATHTLDRDVSNEMPFYVPIAYLSFCNSFRGKISKTRRESSTSNSSSSPLFLSHPLAPNPINVRYHGNLYVVIVICDFCLQ